MSSLQNPLLSQSKQEFVGFNKGRPLRLEIDESAFLHNIRCLDELSTDAELMLVLKANAYGHGLVNMAKLAGVRDIAVAVPEELAVLRAAAIENRVWVLEGPFGSSCLKGVDNVVWVIHSFWQLELFLEYSGGQSFTVCLKLNTGMNRLGLSQKEFLRAAKLVEESEHLLLFACMTHFSSSDIPDNESVERQLDVFNETLVRVLGNTKVLRSSANSGGVLFYPQSHQDIVRPGIALFGAMPAPEKLESATGLKPVMKFKSAVIAMQSVAKGDAVGYGERWVASRDSRIAIVAGGYGDGYPRHAGDGTPVAIYDQISQQYYRMPLAGRVSMDMLAVDVTDMPACQIGSTVELWGDLVSSDEVALSANTISYELFCSITERVPRVYLRAG